MFPDPISIPERAPHPTYVEPPIEEAICDVRFAPSHAWNSAIPGLIYYDLKEAYSGRPEDQQLQEAIVEVGQNADLPKVTTSSTGRLILRSEDGRRVVLIGPDHMSINGLRPYEGWAALRPRVEQALNTYCGVAEPSGVVRLGIRYVNIFGVPASSVDLDTYFKYAPRLDPALGLGLQRFILRTESFHSDGVRVNATLTDRDGEDGVAFLLDLDVFQQWEPEAPMDLSELGTRIADLREHEYQAFEAFITDEARQLFGGSEDCGD